MLLIQTGIFYMNSFRNLIYLLVVITPVATSCIQRTSSNKTTALVQDNPDIQPLLDSVVLYYNDTGIDDLRFMEINYTEDFINDLTPKLVIRERTLLDSLNSFLPLTDTLDTYCDIYFVLHLHYNTRIDTLALDARPGIIDLNNRICFLDKDGRVFAWAFNRVIENDTNHGWVVYVNPSSDLCLFKDRDLIFNSDGTLWGANIDAENYRGFHRKRPPRWGSD